MTVTRDLAEFVARTDYSTIPIPAIEQAKLAIIDAVGTLLAGLDEKPVRLLRDVTARESGPGQATVLGCSQRLTASGAALANAAASHSLDYDNISLTVSGFVTSPVLFALLAVAEEEGHASGKQLLEAFIVGWEVEASIARGLGVHHYAKGWHPTSTLGHFGVAVAVGKLLGLDAKRISYLIGLAAAEASGIRTMIGNMTNVFHVGKAARNGIVAARLVQRGFVAHDHVLDADWGFCSVFNGPGQYDLNAMVRDLGKRYDLINPGLVIKMYPCCGLIHSALDGVLDLVKERDLKPSDINLVRIAVHELVPKTMRYDRPESGYEGKFSTPFCTAVAIRERAVSLDHFTDERVRDQELRKLMACVEMVIHPDLCSYDTFLENEFTDVTIGLNDGQKLYRRVWRLNNRGSKGRPITLSELEHKYQECARNYGDHEGAIEAFRLLKHLESVGDIREVTTCLQ